MSPKRELLRPQKLYSRLRGTASAVERAQAVLGFLCSSTGATAGYLFLVRSPEFRELALACSSLEGGDSPELIAEVTRAWNHDIDRHPEDTRTKTVDAASAELFRDAPLPLPWRNSQNDAFEHRLLSVYRSARWTPIGMAMLKTQGGHALERVRQAHIDALCNALLDAGDVSEAPPAAGND